MMLTGRLTIAVPGEPLQLSHGINERYNVPDARPSPLPAGMITVVAIETNTNDVVLGPRWLDAAVASREGWRMVAAQKEIFHEHLDDLWLDVVTANEGVYFGFKAADPAFGFGLGCDGDCLHCHHRGNGCPTHHHNLPTL